MLFFVLISSTLSLFDTQPMLASAASATQDSVGQKLKGYPLAKQLILKKETFAQGIEELINDLAEDKTQDAGAFELLLDLKNRLAWNKVESGYDDINNFLAYQRLINAVSQLPLYWGRFSLHLKGALNSFVQKGIIIPDPMIPFSHGYNPLNQPVLWGMYDNSAIYIAERDLVGVMFDCKNEKTYGDGAKRLAKIITHSVSRLSQEQLKTVARVVTSFYGALAFPSNPLGFKAEESFNAFRLVLEALYEPTASKLYTELKEKLETRWKKDFMAKGLEFRK